MLKAIGTLILVFITFSIILFTCNYTNDGLKTINKEFSTSALLKKYEYFKDLSSAIQKKHADIEYYNLQIKEEKDNSEKIQLKTELRGIILIHNQLVSEYNSAMSKFNYRFTNIGDLPESNLEVLPREFQNYITK